MCNHGDKVWLFTAWIPQVGLITIRVPACVITGGILTTGQQLLICHQGSCCQMFKYLLSNMSSFPCLSVKSLIQHLHGGWFYALFFLWRKHDLIHLFWCISRLWLAEFHPANMRALSCLLCGNLDIFCFITSGNLKNLASFSSLSRVYSCNFFTHTSSAHASHQLCNNSHIVAVGWY